MPRPLPIVAPLHEREPDAVATLPAPTAHPELRDDDLAALLAAFYERVGDDPLLAPYFAPLDMTAHLPRIVDFWSTMLFHTGRYSGNAFRPHASMPGLEARHFTRWLDALESTIDAHHAGPAAESMKALGHRVAHTMQLRLGITPATLGQR